MSLIIEKFLSTLQKDQLSEHYRLEGKLVVFVYERIMDGETNYIMYNSNANATHFTEKAFERYIKLKYFW